MGNFSIQAKLDIERNPDWDTNKRNIELAMGIIRDAHVQGFNFEENWLSLRDLLFDKCHVNVYYTEDKIYVIPMPQFKED